MQYQRATSKDVAELKDLWLCCFPACKVNYVDEFFHTVFTDTNCFTARTENKIVSMAFAVEYQAFLEQKPHKIAFLTACCTHPDFRQRGIFSSLHGYIKAELESSGFELLFVLPDEINYDHFIKKLSYRNLFYRRGFFVSELPKSFLHIDKDMSLLYSIYLDSLKGNNGFYILESCLQFCLTYRNKNIAVDIENKVAKGFIVYTQKKDGFIIHEYYSIGQRKLAGAGRTVKSAPALPLINNELFDKLYKTKPRLNFLLDREE